MDQRNCCHYLKEHVCSEMFFYRFYQLGYVTVPNKSCSPCLREQGVFRPDGEVLCDGEKVEVNAERELVLRCGKASITLTRAGKILLRGAYVSTRATGVNRVQGGSVQIN